MQTISLSSLFLVLAVLLNSCFGPFSAQLTTKKVMSEGREMLLGETSPAQLYFDYPEWKNTEELYQPDSLILGELRSYRNYHIDVYFGTWCGDSREGVPQFLKIMSAAGAGEKYSLYALNRAKQLPGKNIISKNIQRVPTYIITVDGIETGRIIEFPDVSIEADLLKILKK